MVVPTFKERMEKNPRFNWYNSDFDYEIWIDPTLAHNLLCLLESAKSGNGDIVLVIDGEEGTGKSTLARQVGRLLDSTLTEKRIEFSPDAAKEAHFQGLPSLESREFVPELYRQGKYDGKPWEVVMLDESAKLDRKRTMASSSVDFMGFISQSRQLHKIFIMVLPNVHMLDGYIAEHRTVALIHCEKEKRTNRRIYKWYGRKHLKEMFKTDMHKRKLYPRGAAFSGTFTSKNPFDLTVYEQKKAAALEAYRKKESGDGDPALVGADKEDIIRIIEESAMVLCLKDPKIHQASVYKALNIKYERWKEIRKRCKKKYNINPEPTIGPVKRMNDKKNILAGLLKDRHSGVTADDNIDEYSVEEDDLE